VKRLLKNNDSHKVGLEAAIF